MKKIIMFAGLVAACSASAQFLQNLTQALLEPEPAPAPAQPVQVVADGQTIPVSVPPGNSLVFIRKPAPSAPPVVKTATFR